VPGADEDLTGTQVIGLPKTPRISVRFRGLAMGDAKVSPGILYRGTGKLA
jgi:hypothetical protein